MAFTLIELLIVVLIIAILAAIAVPNFLEFQTRAKVSRVKADMRSLDTALQAYFVDYNHFPIVRNVPPWFHSDITANQNNRGGISRVIALSTPVQYISNTSVADPFFSGKHIDPPPAPANGQDPEVYIMYINIELKRDQENWNNSSNVGFALSSRGPDFVHGPFAVTADCPNLWAGPNVQGNFAGTAALTPEECNYFKTSVYYDPTNGSVSNGDIVRFPGVSN